MVAISRTITMSPLDVLDLNDRFEHGVVDRLVAKAVTPISDGIAVDITGVDQVLTDDGAINYQCVYCGTYFEAPLGARAHLASHGKKRSELEAEEISVQRVTANRYAPFDNDEDNVRDWIRRTEATLPALKRILRESRDKKRGQLTATEIAELKSKAELYDTLRKMLNK